MSGRYGPGPPPPQRRTSDPRMFGPGGPGRGPPPPMNGGRFPLNGGRGMGRFNGRGGGPGRFDDRGRGVGRGRMSSFPPPGRGRGPPPPPPPGRGFRGRAPMPGRGMPPPPGRGPPMQHGHGHHPSRMIPPPPPPRGRPRMIAPPPPPGRGGRGPPPMHHPHPHHAPPGHPPHPGMPMPQQHRAPPSRQHSGPLVHGHHSSHTAAPPQHSVQTAAVTKPDVSMYTKEQIDQGWTEHTAPNSAKYYYNSILHESTFTKPDCWAEKSNVSSSQSDIATQQQQTQSSSWAEYTDPNTGKKYYSDGVTTTWERPAEMGAASSATEVDESEEEEGPKKKKRKRAVETTTEFNNSAEATAAFKGLLLAKGVQPTTKWNEVVKMCSADSRWEACEVLTLGERKQALAEYQTKRANELRTLERQERMRAKEAFVQLLTEKLPTVEEFSATNSHFSDMRAILSKDDRFYAVEKEETRESLFLEFCEEVRKREERKKRSKKREAKDDFLAFLKEREEQGTLTFSSTWASFVGTLEESERNDARFQSSPTLPDSERELLFADYVLDLQAAEEDRRRRIRDAHRRAEKAQKEAYTDALRKLAAQGSILPSSRWRNVEVLIAADPSFAPVQAHDRESPREMFEDFIHEWNHAYRRDRSFLSNLVHSSSAKQTLTVHADMRYDEYSRALLDHAAHSPELYSETRGILNREDPISSARLYFNEMVSRARDGQAKPTNRSMSGPRRGSAESSSEDEGEIREDGEVSGDEGEATKKNASDEQK